MAKIQSHLDVKVHMKPKHSLRSFLSHPKDQIQDADKSNVIYKIGCHDCDARYIGVTSRALKTRLSEHKEVDEKAYFSSSALAEHACHEAIATRLTGQTPAPLILNLLTTQD